jgi:excisionase family DNA binding protein
MDALTPKEVAKELKISESMVYKLLKTAGLPYVALGTRKIIRRPDLEKWIEDQVQVKKFA